MLLVLRMKAIAWLAGVRRERGATAVEYALMLALIAAVIVVAVTVLGHATSSAFDSMATTLGGS